MGLAFSVCNPSDAFMKRNAQRVRAQLKKTFGSAIVLDSPEAPYSSDEVAWSGWSKLQKRARAVLGAVRVPHLLSMEAWCGCYVPVETGPTSFTFVGERTPLAVGSLPALVLELEAVGAALGWPTDDAGLRDLACQSADEDDETDIQTYAELLLAAHVAQARRQVLWVVK
jgi:hypothetical protein